jgi:hypothetical protein
MDFTPRPPSLGIPCRLLNPTRCLDMDHHPSLLLVLMVPLDTDQHPHLLVPLVLMVTQDIVPLLLPLAMEDTLLVTARTLTLVLLVSTMPTLLLLLVESVLPALPP